MISKKNLISVTALFLMTLLICRFSSPSINAVKTASKTENAPQIILDAGHEEFSQYYKSKDYRPKCNKPQAA